MARKNKYPEEFRRRAVDLYESAPGATLRGTAAGIDRGRETLSAWVKGHGTGARAPQTGPAGRGGAAGGPPAGPHPPPPPALGARERPEPPAARSGRLAARGAELEAENARLAAERTALLAEQDKLVTEREILRLAAKYFAGETSW